MIAQLSIQNKLFSVDLTKPIDLSIPLRAGKENVNAFHIPPAEFSPFRMGGFVGDVTQGGACNVFDVKFNPHGNGTHTETVGHITKENYPIYKQLKRFFFTACVVSIAAEEKDGDQVITAAQLKKALGDNRPEALVIRTLPNSTAKLNFQYSGTNPVYLHHEAAALVFEYGIEHLLVDFPSVDREEDGGKLLAHKAFWNLSGPIRENATITEMIFVPDEVADGWYLLNLQTASFDNDASPSKPVLFEWLEARS